MFVFAGQYTRIFVDCEANCLRVQEDKFGPYGYLPKWADIESFTDSVAWYQSPYPEQVIDTDDTIIWFWIDREKDEIAVI